EIANTCVDAYPAPSSAPYGVNYRPGSRLVKVQISNSVYAVGPNNSKLMIDSPEVATALYGANWATLVRDISDAYWPNIVTTGATISTNVPHDGMLLQTASSNDVFHVVDGMKYLVVGDVLDTSEVRTVATAVFDAVETGTGTVTAASVVEDATQLGGMPSVPGDDTPAVGGDVTVSLAASTPASGYVAKGGYNVTFAKFTFTATGGAARVDKVVIQRDGLGADADISAIRLYDGSTQVGSDQALNTVTHLATFNNLNWDLAAGESRTLTVKADTASGATGTYDYLKVTSAELEGTGTITGYPVQGSNMQYHSVSVGGLDVDVNTTPAAKTIISGATEQELVSFNFAASSTEGAYLESFMLTNNGTITDDNLCNFVVKDGATVVGGYSGCLSGGTATLTMDGDSGFFVKLSTSKNLSVFADVGAGITVTTRSIILSIAEAKDVTATGDLAKTQYVVTSGDWTTFTAETGATHTVDQGTLTVAINTATNPTAINFVNGVAHNKIAAYRFTAGSTEGMKVTRLRLTASSGIDSTDWSNYQLYTYDADTDVETSIGSAQSLSGSSITFEDTSDGLFDVEAGKYVVVHVYTDVNTAASYTDNSGSVYIGSTNTNLIVKAKGMSSGDYIAAGDVTLSSVAAANAVVFGIDTTGTLTLAAANDTPAATSIAKGVTNFDFAHFKLTATGEDITVSQLIVGAYNGSGTGSSASGTNDYVNVKLWDITDAANPVQLGSTVAGGSSASSSFSFSLTVPKDESRYLKVTADVPTNSDAGYLHFRVGDASAITSTGIASGTELTETVSSPNGKVMTVSTPTVSVSWASGVTNNMVANASDQTLGTLQLTAGQYEDIKINSIKILVDDATPVAAGSSADTDLTGFHLVGTDGTQYGVTKNLTGGTPDYAQFSGITNLTVTKGTTKILYIVANVAGTSGTYYVGTTAITDIVGTGLVSGTAATISGTGTGRANAINSVATLTLALDAANPVTSLKAVGAAGSGTEEEFLRLAIDAQYEDVDVTKIIFRAVGGNSSDVVQQAFTDNGIKLYHKVGTASETLVGSGTLVSSTVDGISTYYSVTFNVNQGDLRIGKSTDDVLIVKGLLRGTDSGLTTAVSPLFSIGNGTNADDSLYIEARGVQSGTALDDAQFNSTNGVNLSGNQLKVYKSYPTFTYVNPGTTLVSGVENDIYSFKARANGGDVALKQLEFTIDIVDNVGTIDNSIAVHTFKLYRGDTNLTDNVKIQAASSTAGEASLEGATSQFSNATGTGKLFYITWTGTNEELIPTGAEYTYTIKATTAGFNTDADNDYIRVRMNNSEATTEIVLASEPLFYLSPWGSSTGELDILTLDDYTLDGTKQATTSIIWSDRSSASTTHSAATGTMVGVLGGTASSSGDWYNGYYVKDVPTNYSMLVR
ncbi:hypothetical protein KJ641_00255, partial [Patescibacteria group bacterium]|nr:hypothetical protein [Patescibacteria group bacterium]